MYRQIRRLSSAAPAATSSIKYLIKLTSNSTNRCSSKWNFNAVKRDTIKDFTQKSASSWNPNFAMARFSTQSLAQQVEVTQQQLHLPRLPVPALNDTLAKYLRTVKPLLTPDEFQKTTEIVKKFGTDANLGPKLQALLENRGNQMDNWMSDWWLNTAYLEYREPVVVYSSPGLIFPLQTFSSFEDQLKYAAHLARGALRYKQIIDDGNLKADTMGKAQLDMSQYKKIYGTTRNPQKDRDVLKYNPNSKHIVVAYKNYFYKVDAYDSTGNIASTSHLLWQLQNVVEQTQGLSGIPVGILTSDKRDSWAEAYRRLSKDPVNVKSLKILEEALFILSIDRPNRSFDLPKAAQGPSDVEDVEFSEKQTIAALQMLHGNHTNSGNRWFDKTISFVVGTDGEVGLTYEHSPAEGPPIANMMDFIVHYMKTRPPPSIDESTSKKSQPTLLEFNLKDKKIEKAIADAKNNLDGLIQDLNMSAFTFRKYGRDFIKTCKLSPDSYIQMAIQASFFRIHGIPAAHYESASVRMYSRGRTECIRSCSMESLDFSKTLFDSSISPQEKFKYMKKAIDGHKSYAADAVRGYGVDRHLLGLKKIALENGMEIPELFKDDGFVKSSSFRLSTSQVPSQFEAFMCYGPLVPDGYGCCYNPIQDSIVFGISAFNSSPETNAVKFKRALQETLLEMEKVGRMSTMQSKL